MTHTAPLSSRLIKLILALSAARALPVIRQILKGNTVMLGRIIHIATDGADVFTSGLLLREIQLRPDRRYRIVQIHHALCLQVFIALRRMRSAVNGRMIPDKLTHSVQCLTIRSQIVKHDGQLTNDGPAITFSKGKIKLNVPIVRKYGEDNYLELLINPLEGKFAVRRSEKDNRSAVQVSLLRNGQYYPKPISATAFYSTIFGLFDWDTEIGYRIIESLFEQDGESVYIFNRSDSQALMHMETMTALDDSGSEKSDLSLSSQGRNVRAIQAEWFTSFGKEFYFHEQTLIELESQSERDWKLRMEGTTFNAGKKLNVTGFDELKAYIWKELGKEI